MSGQPDTLAFVPVEDCEMIVRAAVSPYHFSHNKPFKGAFHLRAGSRSISAIRGSYVSADDCKEIGIRHVQDLNAQPKPRVYAGLWTVHAACIRQAGAEVSETVGDYERHVSIDYGVVRQRGDALADPRDVERYNAVLDALWGCVKYFQDAAPQAPGWGGPPLTMHICAAQRVDETGTG